MSPELRQLLRHWFVNGLLTVCFFVLVPTCLLCLSPVYIWRLVVILLQPLVRPDLSHLVSPRSTVLGVDGYPTDPKWNLVVWLTLEKPLDLGNFRHYFDFVFVKARDPARTLLYPEYQQRIVTWLGFHWWQWNSKFDSDHHISLYHKHDTVDDTKLVQIVKDLTAAPWVKGQSPWEFLLIPNYSSESNPDAKSLLIFRLHHLLGDGYFILKLLMEDISGIPLTTAARPSRPSSTTFSRVLSTPSEFMRMSIDGFRRDDNLWHLRQAEMSGRTNAALSPRFRLDTIKRIRYRHGVSFSAVLNAAVVGGMRRMMIQQGVTPPAEIHQAVAVPMEGHPGKLKNHFIFAFITLPIGTEDPIQRLEIIEHTLQNLKSSLVPLITFWLVPFVGSLLPWMMSPFTTNNLTTTLMSNFPGTPTTPKFCGVTVLDMMFGAGLGPGTTGVGFTLISYVDFIRILTVVDSSILASDSLVESLNEKILEELELLEKLKSGKANLLHR